MSSKEDFLKKIQSEALSLKKIKPSIKDLDKGKLKEKGKKLLKGLFN